MTNTTAVTTMRFEGRKPPVKKKLTDHILVGKDILELVSGAMYIEPLTIIREYIQNAVDAIDEAEVLGLYSSKVKARVDIIVNLNERKLRIRDNGIGVNSASFAKRLTAFGGSKKRGSRARGFRGVGRLSGLGYSQELIFRSRSAGDSQVMELAWDGRRFKDILLDPEYKGDLNEVVREVTTLTSYSGTGYPKHFFEVELCGVARHKNDILLNEHEIEQYLAQAAPAPFHPNFCFGPAIEDHLGKYGLGRSYEIFVSTVDVPDDNAKQVFRSYRDTFTVYGGGKDHVSNIVFLELPGIDGTTAAVGWVLDHSYYGAVPKSEGIKGLRLRSGNIQVGSDEIVAEAFPEPRFNSWMIGEIHVLAPKLIPNGRRDAFEMNAHYLNLQGHVAAYAKIIAKTCRDKSKVRNQDRKFELEKEKIDSKLAILARRSIPRPIKEKIRKEITLHIKNLEKLLTLVGDQIRHKKYEQLLQRIKTRLGKNLDEVTLRDPLARLPKSKQSAYRHVIGLIFECTPNPQVAGALVERVLAKLSR